MRILGISADSLLAIPGNPRPNLLLKFSLSSPTSLAKPRLAGEVGEDGEKRMS
jgi:hypothetical protein